MSRSGFIHFWCGIERLWLRRTGADQICNVRYPWNMTQGSLCINTRRKTRKDTFYVVLFITGGAKNPAIRAGLTSPRPTRHCTRQAAVSSNVSRLPGAPAALASVARVRLVSVSSSSLFSAARPVFIRLAIAVLVMCGASISCPMVTVFPSSGWSFARSVTMPTKSLASVFRYGPWLRA